MEFHWRLALHRCPAVEQYPKLGYNYENKTLSKYIALFLCTTFFDLCPGTEMKFFKEIMHIHVMVQDLHGPIVSILLQLGRIPLNLVPCKLVRTQTMILRRYKGLAFAKNCPCFSPHCILSSARWNNSLLHNRPL